jgi:hypothetical protein
MIEPMPGGHLEHSDKRGVHSEGIQAYRARVSTGLRIRGIGRWTFQVTAGTADPGVNTLALTADGVNITGGAVDWITSHAATAEDICDAINANSATTGFFATVSTDTVTIRQKRSGAVVMAKVEAGDAEGTLSAAFASTNTWTEVVSGATVDGDEYYELGFSGALVKINGVSTDNLRAIDLDLYCDGQAFTLWTEIRTASNAIVQGLPMATATWLHATYGGYWPILDSRIPLIIKLAADEELLYHVGVI